MGHLIKELKCTFINFETSLIAGIGASLSPLLTYLYGDGRTKVINAFFLLIILDWITGIAASIKDKTYTSAYGISGILRTLFILMFPALANFLDTTFNTPGFLFYGVTFGLIYHTWQSTTANAVRAGWEKWIPDSVIQFVESEIKAKADRSMMRSQNINQDQKDEKTGEK